MVPANNNGWKWNIYIVWISLKYNDDYINIQFKHVGTICHTEHMVLIAKKYFPYRLKTQSERKNVNKYKDPTQGETESKKKKKSIDSKWPMNK